MTASVPVESIAMNLLGCLAATAGGQPTEVQIALVSYLSQLPGSIRPEVVSHWMLRLIEVVRFAHQLTPPLVHRDLKPANVLVQRRADGDHRLRITDFGISDDAAVQQIRKTIRSRTHTVAPGGFTPLYASEEQMQGKPADPRDDIHALGVIRHQCLTDDLNRRRPSGRAWRRTLLQRGVSEDMLDLLESYVDDEPSARPDHAGVLNDRLTALQTPREPLLQPVREVVRSVAGVETTLTNSIGMELR